MEITNKIKVVKPKTPKNWFSKLIESYTKKWYKWFYSLPKNGDKIRLTWLPNSKNHPSIENCYIGSEGIVMDMDESPLTDGSFTLKMESSYLILPFNKKGFEYEKLK